MERLNLIHGVIKHTQPNRNHGNRTLSALMAHSFIRAAWMWVDFHDPADPHPPPHSVHAGGRNAPRRSMQPPGRLGAKEVTCFSEHQKSAPGCGCSLHLSLCLSKSRAPCLDSGSLKKVSMLMCWTCPYYVTYSNQFFQPPSHLTDWCFYAFDWAKRQYSLMVNLLWSRFCVSSLALLQPLQACAWRTQWGWGVIICGAGMMTEGTVEQKEGKGTLLNTNRSAFLWNKRTDVPSSHRFYFLLGGCGVGWGSQSPFKHA